MVLNINETKYISYFLLWMVPFVSCLGIWHLTLGLKDFLIFCSKGFRALHLVLSVIQFNFCTRCKAQMDFWLLLSSCSCTIL